MNPDFWRTRWSEGRIGFHEGSANALLTTHSGRLGKAQRVLVPLCGKAEDMVFLAALGHQVLGVELVEEAAQAFFAEHALKPASERRGKFLALSSGGITLLVGDFFELTPEAAGPVDALYDRAALIALPPRMRERYAQKLRSLLPQGAKGLVITLEYLQEQQEGPPFVVLEPELRQLYAGLELELLGERTSPGPRSQPRAPGKERCYLLSF